MSKIFGILTLVLFSGALLFYYKGRGESKSISQSIVKAEVQLIEVELEDTFTSPMPATSSLIQLAEASPPEQTPTTELTVELPDDNRIAELFQTKGPHLPVVETITYKSRVSWLKGRPAWLSDYASHYETSRHFIARSLNNKVDYLKQDIAEGDKFNVFLKDAPIEFNLIVDASRCKMWLYCVNLSSKEKFLLKTYKVGLGRPDGSKDSGLLTPLGKYSLGNRIAIYKPGVMGHHKGQKVEMITIFGTRWIPFEKEISHCTAPAKGFGLHGVPWIKNKNNIFEQDALSIGKYESDGCIRMSTEDIEEIYAIIITKPAFIEVVKDFNQSSLFSVDSKILTSQVGKK